MIRVNLLPGDERRQRRAAVSFKVGDMVVPIALLGAVLLLIAGTAMSQRARIAALGRSISEVDAQARALAPQIERVNRLAQERAELDLRLGIIHRLETGRTRTVRVMDELARCLPDHLWLTSAVEDGDHQMTIEGGTLSNLVVSDFLSRLDRSPMFSNVELQVAQRAPSGDRDIVTFHLTCQVTPDEPAN